MTVEPGPAWQRMTSISVNGTLRRLTGCNDTRSRTARNVYAGGRKNVLGPWTGTLVRVLRGGSAELVREVNRFQMGESNEGMGCVGTFIRERGSCESAGQRVFADGRRADGANHERNRRRARIGRDPGRER